MKNLCTLLIFACSGLDNSTLIHRYTFYFPAYREVEDLRMTIWPRQWVKDIEEREGVDVTDSESAWLSEFSFYSNEELRFIEGISAQLGSDIQKEISLAWTEDFIPTKEILLEVDSSIELLDYAHVDSTYIVIDFKGTRPKHDVDTTAKVEIGVEGTWGQACSIGRGLGQKR